MPSKWSDRVHVLSRCLKRETPPPRTRLYMSSLSIPLSPSRLELVVCSNLGPIQILAPQTTYPMMPCSQLWSLLAPHLVDDDSVFRLSTGGKQAHCS